MFLLNWPLRQGQDFTALKKKKNHNTVCLSSSPTIPIKRMCAEKTLKDHHLWKTLETKQINNKKRPQVNTSLGNSHDMITARMQMCGCQRMTDCPDV